MNIIKTINDVAYTADQWELYPNADECALRLNAKLEELVNSGLSKTDVSRAMIGFMSNDMNAKHGAADSEPVYKLGRLLDKVFGNG